MRFELLPIPERRPFPNSALPVIHYPEAMSGDRLAERMTALFDRHGWPGAWLNGVYAFHHFHADAHEVLGCARGWVTVLLGGPEGQEARLSAGDIVLLPAGVGHYRVAASPDYLIVGSYPRGQSPDLQRGDHAAFEALKQRALRVEKPLLDPVYGSYVIMASWQKLLEDQGF